MNNLIPFLLLFFSFHTLMAQKTYHWKELVEAMSSSDTSILSIGENDRLINDGQGAHYKIDPSRFKDGRLVVNRKVEIFRPKILNKGTDVLFFTKFHFKQPTQIDITNSNISVNQSIFDQGVSINCENPGEWTHAGFTKNEVYGAFRMTCTGVHLNIEESLFNGSKEKARRSSDIVFVHVKDCPQFSFDRNKIKSRQPFNTVLQNINRTSISGNEVTGNCTVYAGLINEHFDLSKNSFKDHVHLILRSIPAHSEIEWSEIRDKLAIENNPDEFYYAAESIKDSKTFRMMTETYKTLYDLYKGKGDLASSNAVFVAAKNLEGDRLEAVFGSDGGFENYFSWKLNRLMKLYTDHATRPALALVVSVYIILGFAVFYFFFPSDWDIETKGRLIQHFKDFVRKNDKGYVKPFLKMTWGFVLSLINAITLSLNAFVTLGFGNIPSKGLARYVCVVQGFIGWFLLSIFTVALFNQVLF